LPILAADPGTRKAIETMVAQTPSLQKLDFGANIALTAHGSQFCRPASGLSETKRRVQLLVEKKPTSDALLKALCKSC